MEFILSFILLQILEQMGAVELFSMKKTNKPAGRIYRREAVREGLHLAVHLSQHHRSLISRVCDDTLTGGLIYLAT